VPEASNRRFIVLRSQISSQEISDVLRAKFPELADCTPKGDKPGSSSLRKGAYDADSKTAMEVLGIEKWRGMEATFGELTRQCLDIEQGKEYAKSEL
jgi:hypothetical protein